MHEWRLYITARRNETVSTQHVELFVFRSHSECNKRAYSDRLKPVVQYPRELALYVSCVTWPATVTPSASEGMRSKYR